MEILMQLLVSYLTTLGFAFFFHAPRRAVPLVGLTGALGWTTYVLLNQWWVSLVPAVFMGALLVGLSGEVAARILKLPVTVFVIPGIVPLVPGYGLYRVMYQMIGNHVDEAIGQGVEVLLVAGAISVAVILVSSLAGLFNRAGGEMRSRRSGQRSDG